MTKKMIISADLKAGTEITFVDYSKLAKDGEAVVEVHYHYDVIYKYDIYHYPEHYENAQNALKGGDAWICKTVYHMPAETETN